MSETKKEIQEYVIKEFVRSLIASSAPKIEKKEFMVPSSRQQVQLHQQVPSFQINPKNIQEKKVVLTPKVVRLTPSNLSMQSLPIQRRPPQRINQFQPNLPPPPQKESANEVKINLGRTAQFLSDPAVLSIECPGPGKNVLINKAGSIQATQITLSEEEINSLMEEISEKTRVPIVSGLFRAAYKDILITAVISEFVGTRFIIQKRTPFKMY
ncbi:MAG: hypothetical protein AABX73_04020 [Nanoarchaeota archaeon]